MRIIHAITFKDYMLHHEDYTWCYIEIPCCFMMIIHAITFKDSMLFHEDYTWCNMEIPCSLMRIIYGVKKRFHAAS